MNSATIDPDEIDPIAKLQEVDPLTRRQASYSSSLDRELLFQQITNSEAKAHSTFDWRPRLAIPALVAGLAVATLAATFVFAGGSPSTAAAAVAAAAEPTVGQDSGRIDVTIDVRTSPPSGAPLGTSLASYSFEGEDFAATFTSTDPAADFSSLTLTQLGDRFFMAGLLPDGLIVESPVDETDWDVDFDSIVGASRNSTDENAMVRIVEAMEDLVEVAENDGVITYKGELPSAVLSQADPATLPPGLALLAGTAPYGPTGVILFDDLPDSLGVEFTVTDGTLTRLDVTVAGETTDGPLDATITTHYEGFGEAQNIEAPDPELVVSPEEFEQLFGE